MLNASRRAENRARRPVPLPGHTRAPPADSFPAECPNCKDAFCPEERCKCVGDFYTREASSPGEEVDRGDGGCEGGAAIAPGGAGAEGWELVSAGCEAAGEQHAVDLQVCMCLDVTGSMSSMLEGAKRGLRSAWSGIQQAIDDEQDVPQVAAICYKDYGDRKDGRGAALQFTGRTQGPATSKPLFSKDRELVHTFLQPQVASGGGDTPEMVELALAAGTVLPWSGQIQTMYLALDAPPHCHGHPNSCCGDNWPTVRSIRDVQRAFGPEEKAILDLAVHPECWMTQAIILARLGVIINPMICTIASDVVFFAAFLAELTGGQAVFLDNSQLGPSSAGAPPTAGDSTGNSHNQGGDLLERYVREYTALEIADVRALQDRALSVEERARVERANAEALLGLPEKYNMRVPGKEVSEAIAKLFVDENIKGDLVFSFPGKGTAAPVEERVPGLPEGAAFVRLPGFDESAFQAASRLLPKYNRALAKAVKHRMGVATAGDMRGYRLEARGGTVDVSETYMHSRTCARGVQQLNFASIKSLTSPLPARKGWGTI